MRTEIAWVTFKHPFTLMGFETPHTPGSFEVRTDHERLDASVEAWRRAGTTIMLQTGGMRQAWPVEPTDLEQALKRDEAADLSQ